MSQTEHDLLCPMAGQTSRDIYLFGIPCECDLIARVRADERRKASEEIAAYVAVLAHLGRHEALYSCPGAGCYFTAGGPADELYGLKLKHINQTGHPAGPIEYRPDAPQVLDLAAIARRIWGAS